MDLHNPFFFSQLLFTAQENGAKLIKCYLVLYFACVVEHTAVGVNH